MHIAIAIACMLDLQNLDPSYSIAIACMFDLQKQQNLDPSHSEY